MAINKKELSEAGTQFYPETHIEAVIDGNGNTLDTLLSGKQDELVSGTNIKTVNSTSLLGSGNVSVGTYSKPSGGIPKTDLASEVQTSLGKADSALQSYTETDPTVPSWAKASSKPSYNFSEIGSKPTTISGYGITDAKIASGTITLGSNTITPLTSFTETDPIFSASAAAGISSSDISSWNGKQDTISDLSTIRSGAEAGATAYQLPSTGIPKTDLASAVQTSLGKADTALQSFTETDPVFSASAAAGISSSDITNWNGKTSNIGTITSVKMNGSTVSSSGEADLGTVITSHQDISGKADKVSSATNGNFAGLDANGNLVDSGHKHSDYLTSFTETDPTVPSWAKASSKPSYTLDEVSDGSTRKLANYLPLAGGTMTGAIKLTTGVGIQDTGNNNLFVWGGTNVLSVGFAELSGATLMFRSGNNNLTHRRYTSWSAYTDNTIYDSGNSNKSDVAWRCSTLTTNGDVSVTGNITASGTITPGSDSRIKKNQKEISNDEGIRVLENLTPKTWELNLRSNDNHDGQFGAGLIAQEVKEVVPGAVTVSEMAGFKDFHSLNYNTIQGYEIAAIKGLIEENKALKSEVAELKEKLNAIMEMLK